MFFICAFYFLLHIFTGTILWSTAKQLGPMPVRVLWGWIINPLLPNYVIAAIKSSRCKPDVGPAYLSRVKCITLGMGTLPSFILRTWIKPGSRLQGGVAPTSSPKAYRHPETSSWIVISGHGMYAEFVNSEILRKIFEILGFSLNFYKGGH